MIEIDRTKCAYCGACVGVCPAMALRLRDIYVEVYNDKCTSCGACVRACPMNAIELKK
ncbi:MAG: 4Fe-4S binding protein [Candidatus Micrarchaeota archaeon]|nr:4Fe-4S binding protein [Candidatus Micrarchaeota archaeon]